MLANDISNDIRKNKGKYLFDLFFSPDCSFIPRISVVAYNRLVPREAIGLPSTVGTRTLLGFNGSHVNDLLEQLIVTTQTKVLFPQDGPKKRSQQFGYPSAWTRIVQRGGIAES